jgi:hypothetical protein
LESSHQQSSPTRPPERGQKAKGYAYASI